MLGKTIKEKSRRPESYKGDETGMPKIDFLSHVRGNQKYIKGISKADHLLRKNLGSSSSRKFAQPSQSISRLKHAPPTNLVSNKLETANKNARYFIRNYLASKGQEAHSSKGKETENLVKEIRSSKLTTCQPQIHYIHSNYRNPEVRPSGGGKTNSSFHFRYKSNQSVSRGACSQDHGVKAPNKSLMISLFSKNLEKPQFRKLVATKAPTSAVNISHSALDNGQERYSNAQPILVSGEIAYSPKNRHFLNNDYKSSSKFFAPNHKSDLQMIDEMGFGVWGLGFGVWEPPSLLITRALH